MTNTAAVVGGNVTGNIGSCSIVSTDISVSTAKIQTVAVNSCTGAEVFRSEPYFGVGIVMSMLIVIVMISIFGIVVRES